MKLQYGKMKMNNPELTGVVRLEDLPEKEVYIEFDKRFIKELHQKIKKNCSMSKFSKEMGEKRIIYHIFYKDCSIRLDILKKILKYFNMNLQEVKRNIQAIRGKLGGKIKKSNLSFDFTTKAGVRFIAAIMGDGCLDKKYRIFYGNTKEELIKGFISDSKEIFDESCIMIERMKGITIVSLSPICGRIVHKIGLKLGKKIITNNHVPQFIFNLEKDKISEFLSQIIDDEGGINLKSRYLKIKFAVLSSKGICNVAKDTSFLIKKLGVNCSLYNFEKRSYNNKERTFWQIQVHSMIELKKLYSFLNLRHNKKTERLELLFDTIKQIQYPKKECTNIYLSIMRDIQKIRGFFNCYDLSKETNRDLGSCRNTMCAFRKKGLIRCIEPYKSGKIHSFAKFEVIE